MDLLHTPVLDKAGARACPVSNDRVGTRGHGCRSDISFLALRDDRASPRLEVMVAWVEAAFTEPREREEVLCAMADVMGVNYGCPFAHLAYALIK